MTPSFAELKQPKKGVVVVAVGADSKLSASAKALDKAAGGALSRAMAGSRFQGKKGEAVDVIGPAGLEDMTVVLVGTGDGKAYDALAARAHGASILRHLSSLGATTATVMVDAMAGSRLDPAARAANLAYGARLASYRFDKYLTKKKKEKRPTTEKLSVMVKGAAAARRAYAPLAAVADGVDFTRDLVSEPGNIIYPDTLAKECRKLSKIGVKVEVLGEAAMAKLGMGALLGVGMGSDRESKLAIMQWQGAAKSKKPVAFVGKGVTFDTGGISIKPAGGMHDMKWDMGGSGAVIGAMHALAARKAKVNVVGIVGLVENMPSGSAQRPGDIVTSMSGQTIEVLNTDAEGRLVLADAMWYCQDRFKPEVMIDLATLTGAIMVALGSENGGLYANDDKLADNLVAAGKAVGEALWRMPLGDAYDRQIDAEQADMKNIGAGRWAGSITAAQFLQRFTNDVPWAHLDIAGMAWSDKTGPTMHKGATAFGVQLLDRFIADNYE